MRNIFLKCKSLLSNLKKNSIDTQPQTVQRLGDDLSTQTNLPRVLGELVTHDVEILSTL